MPSKGTQNFMDGLSGLFGKKETPQEKMRSEQNKLAADRSREENMISKLQSIEFAMAELKRKNKLPFDAEMFGKCESLVHAAINMLKQPAVIAQDIQAIDAHMENAIDTLKTSIDEGLRSTAEFACAALRLYLINLRAEVPDADAQYAEALMDERLKYAETLKTLLGLSREYDNKKKVVAELEAKKVARDEELVQQKAEIKAYQDTPEGAQAFAEIKEYAASPAMMSQSAKKLRSDLNELAKLKGICLNMGVTIDTYNAKLLPMSSSIEALRVQLMEQPTVTDPQIQEKVYRAQREHVEKLNRQLNEANESMKAFDQYLSMLSSLQDHEVFARMAAVAKNELDALEMEELLAQQRKKDLLARQKRAVQQKQAMARQEKQLDLELEKARIELDALNEQRATEVEAVEEVEEEELAEEIFIME